MAMFVHRNRELEADVLRLYREVRHRTSCAQLTVEEICEHVYQRRKSAARRFFGFYWTQKPRPHQVRQAIHHLQDENHHIFRMRRRAGDAPNLHLVSG